jgi:hypothetical protein
MTKDRDELYGLHLRGTDRPMPFINPYRKTGELSEIELLKLERHPLEIADATSTPTRRRARQASPRFRARSSASSGPESTPRSRAAMPS